MQRFKKVVSLLLCLNMLVSMLPMSVLAVDTTEKTAVDSTVIFSDLHAMFDGDSSDGDTGYKKTKITNMMTALKNNNAGLKFSSVHSAGDAFSSNERAYTGYTDTITGYIQSVLGDIPVGYVWSDHDRAALDNSTSKTALDKTSHLSYGAGKDGEYGTSDDANYYVYYLSMADLSSFDRYTAEFSSNDRAKYGYTESIEKAIENFKADVAKLKEDRPLFIVGHQPLFDRRDDNAFAEQWFEAINEVAKTKDVAYFFGHNHNYDKDGDYYYAKGSDMYVASKEGWAGYQRGTNSNTSKLTGVKKTLNFTHMCAGYFNPETTGYYGSSRVGTAMVVTIYEDSIHYSIQDSNGVYKDTDKDGISEELNVTVDRAFNGKNDTPDTPDTPETPEVPESGKVYVLVDQPVDGGKYLITNVSLDNMEDLSSDWKDKGNTTVPGQAVVKGSKAMGHVAVTPVEGEITGADGVTYSDGYIVIDNADAVWTAVKNSSDDTYAFVNDTTYIGSSLSMATANVVGSNSFANGGTSVIRNSNNLPASSNPVYWSYDAAGNRLKNNDNFMYFSYIYNTVPSESDWVWRTTTSDSSSASSTRDIFFYQEVELKADEQEPEVPETPEVPEVPEVPTQPEIKDEDTQVTVSAPGLTGLNVSPVTSGAAYNVAAKKLAAGFVAYDINVEGFENGSGTATVTLPLPEGVTEPAVYYISDDGKAVELMPISKVENGSVTFTTNHFTTYAVGDGDNYPVYPEAGSVTVNKTGEGIDFTSTGVAKIELSTSGVPLQQGVDVIVMLDTSSSMARHIDCGEKSCRDATCSKVTRMQELRSALQKMEDTFKEQNADGTSKDIRVAMADFNGFYSDPNSPYFGNNNNRGDHNTDQTEDKDDLTGNSNAKIYTGSKQLNAGAFVDAQILDTSAVFTASNSGYTGTNYDYAFDAIYQLGQAIKAQNKEAGVERDLYVIFMSDGAPNQYNYYGSIGGDGGSDDWEYWLTGAIGKDVKVVDIDGTVKTYTSKTFREIVDCQTHTYYFDESNGNQHRMANAVKGDPNDDYEIIRKATGLTGMVGTNEANMYKIKGLGATMYSIAFAPANDGPIDRAAMLHVLRNIATSTDKHYYEATAAGALSNVFGSIAGDIANAATNARFVDQMGSKYNLQMAQKTYPDGVRTIDPFIEVVTSDNGTETLNEVVKFSVDGKKAYSNLIDVDGDGICGVKVEKNTDGTYTYTIFDEDDNILRGDGVILAKNFIYNTSSQPVTISGVEIPAGVNEETKLTTTPLYKEVPPETFYWKLGNISRKTMTMRYYVYLDGSMEGERPAGVYDTNTYANLYYDNYLGNPCYKVTESPELPWEDAQVSYGFYLVDEQGRIIKQDNTVTSSFADKVIVSDPVKYDDFCVNNGDTIKASDLTLPQGYVLYDPSAAYHVTATSYGTGSWEITKCQEVQSTYVTNYDSTNANVASNALTSENVQNGNYANTTVWFALVPAKANPDVVVIDYGLPVDIDVLANDVFGADRTLESVASDEWKYGKAEVNAEKNKVRYQLDSMVMNGYERFNYTAQFQSLSYSSTVTVIPATTIYFEDSFVSLESYTWEGNDETGDWTKVNSEHEKWVWSQDGTTTDAVQGEDRPGFNDLVNDANNLYGYDSAYTNSSTYSMGSAMIAHVDWDNYGAAEFTFAGTGFDVISLTSNKTGTIFVTVYDNEGKVAKYSYTDENGVKKDKACQFMVDTYYGYARKIAKTTYTYDGSEWVASKEYVAEKGESGVRPENPEKNAQYVVYAYEWVIVDSNSPNALYQVPVMKVEGLKYGTYTAVIEAMYDPISDHGQYDDESFDFYLDAIRIYDPANDGADDSVISEAYKEDKEYLPDYFELRNWLISANTFDSLGNKEDSIPGIIFIDGAGNTANVGDYKNFGPNNELYLAPGQAVAFYLDGSAAAKAGYAVESVQLALKSVGGTAKAKIWGADAPSADTASEKEIATATDLYYDITKLDGKNVVIMNSDDAGAMLSITNVKITYKASVESTGVSENGRSVFSISAAGGQAALMSLRGVATGEDEPTNEPTDEPTNKPTDEPTDKPTDEPADKPTDEPTDKPTDEPTDEPGADKPAEGPTNEPQQNHGNQVAVAVHKVLSWVIGILNSIFR